MFHSVSASSIPTHNTHRFILAVGLEDGRISLHTCPTPSQTLSPSNFWSVLLTLSPAHCHTSTVKRLKWRPTATSQTTKQPMSKTEESSFEVTQTKDSETLTDKNRLYLASCSTDHCVKIFAVKLHS